jgi:hypothetical protein
MGMRRSPSNRPSAPCARLEISQYILRTGAHRTMNYQCVGQMISTPQTSCWTWRNAATPRAQTAREGGAAARISQVPIAAATRIQDTCLAVVGSVIWRSQVREVIRALGFDSPITFYFVPLV